MTTKEIAAIIRALRYSDNRSTRKALRALINEHAEVELKDYGILVVDGIAIGGCGATYTLDQAMSLFYNSYKSTLNMPEGYKRNAETYQKYVDQVKDRIKSGNAYPQDEARLQNYQRSLETYRRLAALPFHKQFKENMDTITCMIEQLLGEGKLGDFLE